MAAWVKTITGALLTTIIWVIATFVTPSTDKQTLRSFYRLIKPAGPGWKRVVEEAAQDGDPLEDAAPGGQLPMEILLMVVGCFTVYGALFASGHWIYGNQGPAIGLTVATAVGSYILFKTWRKLKTE